DSWNQLWEKELQELFEEMFPIRDYTGKQFELGFVSFKLEKPKYKSGDEAKENDDSFDASIRVRFSLKNLKTGAVEITTQNHGFAIYRQSLKKIKRSSYKITHMNLNDNTIEGIEYPEIKAFSIQHHPEAGPGPYDSRYIFKDFKELIEKSNA
ncbi:MAG: hypothetical protein KJ770_06630, partial [Actinobacteria bacterium]|nr:hypothetical protein [Actinomycetota bacterium]